MHPRISRLAPALLAREFSKEAHDSIGQTYNGEAYYLHTWRVQDLVASTPGTSDESIIVSPIHDVEEDVSPKNPYYGLKTINTKFGLWAESMVLELSNEYTRKKYPKLSRSERIALEIEKKSKMTPNSQTVKYADIIDNCKNIVDEDPVFALVYLHEKKKFLEVMTSGNQLLRAEAILLVNSGLNRLLTLVV